MAEVVSGLLVGQRFSSLEEFKSAIRNISVRQHWDLRVVRSNKKSVVLGCRSSANCYFRVVCRANKNATYITSLQDTHSCRRNLASPGSTPARSEASHVRFLLNEIPKLFDMKSKIKGQDVVDAVKRYHGYDISMRQAQRALTKLQPRQSRGGHAQVDDHEDHDLTHDQSSSVRVNHETFDPLADDRGWAENGLSTSLMEDDSIDQDDSPTETTSAALIRAQQNNQSLTTMSHHAQPGPSDTRSLSVSTMSHHASQIAPLQPSGQGQYVQPIQLPVPPSPPKTQNSPSLRHPHPQSHPQPRPQPPLPSPQHQQPTHAGHPVAAQLVLTNFKIEFTCTSCGALNQSFFPNQGHVTGHHYLPPAATHGIPPSAPPGPPPPSAATNGRLGTLDGVAADSTTNAVAAAAGFGDTDYQTSTASHGGRELPPWGGGLDVSIPPPNT